MGNAIGWVLLTGIVVVTVVALVKRPGGASHELIWTAVGGLAAIAAFAYTVSLEEGARKREPVARTMELMDMIWSKVSTTIREFYPASWPLYREINPDAKLPKEAEAQSSEPLRSAPEFANHQIGQSLIQATEHILHMRRSGFQADSTAWTVTALRWWQSPLLRMVWEETSSNYSHSVQWFVCSLMAGADHLIQLRGQKGELCSKDYYHEARMVLSELTHNPK